MAVAEAPNESKQEKETVNIVFQVPIDFQAVIKSKADEKGLSIAAYCRGLVADELDYTLPPMQTRVSKYATVEERKAAQAAKQKQRNQLIGRLLKAVASGAINLSDLEDDDEEEDES